MESHGFNSATEKLFVMRGPLASQVASQMTSIAVSPNYGSGGAHGDERKEAASPAELKAPKPAIKAEIKLIPASAPAS